MSCLPINGLAKAVHVLIGYILLSNSPYSSTGDDVICLRLPCLYVRILIVEKYVTWSSSYAIVTPHPVHAMDKHSLLYVCAKWDKSAPPILRCQFGAANLELPTRRWDNSVQGQLNTEQSRGNTDRYWHCAKMSPCRFTCAVLSRRRIGIAESAATSCPRPMSVCLVLSQPRAVLKQLNRSRSRLGCELGWAPGTVY